MNATFRKSLMAGAIAALISAPGWAAGEAASPNAAGSAGAATSAQAGASEGLYSKTPQELRNMEVMGSTGEKIGTISSVVSSAAEPEQIHLVISSGEAIGGKEVAIPLNEATLVGDKVHLSATKAEIDARPEYQSDQYAELQPADQPISDFAAFETVPGQESQPPGQWSEPATPGTSSPDTYREGTPGSETPSSPGTMER